MRETNVKNREAVIGALSSFLRGINTEGKREFLSEYAGLGFFKGAIQDAKDQVRLSKKLVFLLLDFVQND